MAIDQAFVTSLISRKGFNATLTRLTSSYDVATGVNTNTESDSTVKIVPPESYEHQFVDGRAVQIGDTFTYLSAQGLSPEPKPGDRLTIDGEEWQIVGAEATYLSDGNKGLWKVQLRK